MKHYLTTADLAERLNVPESTVRYWRFKDRGPASVKAEGRVLYPLAEVERWEASLLESARGGAA